MPLDMEVHGENRVWHNTVALWLYQKRQGAFHLVQPVDLVVKAMEDSVAHITEPSLVLGRNTMVEIMTTLWRLGVRPNGEDFRGTSGQLEAMGSHLQDLRRLVFKGLDNLEPRER